MKINPFDPTQAMPRSASNDSKNGEPSVDFSHVLNKRIDNVSKSQAMVRSQPKSALNPAFFETQDSFQKQTTRLMQSLEQYQSLLGDSRANLRQIEPTVLKMKKQAELSENLLKTMAAESPMKPVLEELLTLTSVEIARFDQGYYMDEH